MFVLGTLYLNLGVLRHVFGVRYVVYVLVSQAVLFLGKGSVCDYDDNDEDGSVTHRSDT